MFPPVAWKLNPQERAKELIMEEEITLQAREQQAVAGRVQALREKFAAAANDKCSPAQELEVRWVRAQPGLSPEAPDAAMAEATLTLPGIQPEPSAVKRGSRGSKFCQAATRAEGMSARLNGQLKEQKRIPDTANALAASLRDSARPPGQLTSATSLESIPVGQATQVHQGSSNSLASDLATLCQDLQSRSPAMPTRATPSLSTADSFVYELSSLSSPAVEQASALNASQYSSVPHNHLLENEVNDSPGHDMAHRMVPGSSGHFCFLQVGINYLPDQDLKTTALLGLSALMDILPDTIDGFEIHLLEEASTLPIITNNKSEDGFPVSAVLAFKYFLVRDRGNVRGQQTASPSAPSPYRYNDEEDYKPPTPMWGVIRVKGNSNIKEACDALAWDKVDSGLTVRWKEHQSAESSAHILVMNVPLVLERGGVESEIVWHLTDLEKRLMKKGGYPQEYVGVQLPKISVAWKQSK
jgi:hypothetical protein